GHRQMLDLVDRADVFLQNWRPGVAESLGLGACQMLERNPRLVYIGVTGFGSSGPKSRMPVFDSLVQSTTGLAHYEGEDDRPRLMRSFIADKVSGLMAAQAVLAALVARSRTGRGTCID